MSAVAPAAKIVPRAAGWWAAAAATVVAAVGAGYGAAWAGVVLGLWSLPVVVAAVEDASTSRLRDAVVVPGVAVVLFAVAVSAALDRDGGVLVRSLLGAVSFAGWLLVVHLVAPAGMGFGDVKYGGLLGLGVGLISPVGVVLVVVAATVLQVGVVVIRPLPAQRSGVVGRREAPFGPALAAASIGFVVLVLAFGGGRL